MTASKQILVQQFVNTSSTLKRLIGRFSAVSLEEKITTSLQFQALAYLQKHSFVTVGELAQELAVSSSSIAQLIDRLVVAGWVKRKNDKKDRRVIHLSLTNRGIEELSLMKHKYIKKISCLLSLIPEKDVKDLVRIQSELIQKLEAKK